MCGRYTLTTNATELQTTFDLDSVPQNLAPRYNIAPSQPVAVVLNRDGSHEIDMFRWGLIPFWAKEKAIGNKMINARAETLAQKPTLKHPLKKQRCLIPATVFFEWQKTPSGKIPMYIHPANKGLFAFAGLWDRWIDMVSGEAIYSCTIITTTPNSLMSPIHNRMPVILPPVAFNTWLNPAEVAADALLPLLKPYPADEMAHYAVSTLVNSPANDLPACILPV